MAVYKDPVEGQGRGVSCTAWAPGGDRVALGYAIPQFLARSSLATCVCTPSSQATVPCSNSIFMERVRPKFTPARDSSNPGVKICFAYITVTPGPVLHRVESEGPLPAGRWRSCRGPGAVGHQAGGRGAGGQAQYGSLQLVGLRAVSARRGYNWSVLAHLEAGD